MIKSGEAEVFSTMGDHRQSLSILGPGKLFGEVAAVRKIPRTASVVATNRVETLRLRGADFHAILAAKPDVRDKVNKELERRVRDNIDKLTAALD